MRKVFNNQDLESKFQKDGYVSVPFITAEEVAALKQKFFDTLKTSGGQITREETGVQDSRLVTYDFTFIDKNPDHKKEVFDIITSFFEKKMNELLANYRPIIANYIRKMPQQGEVPLHENWAFADEKKCATVSIWCPLVDSTTQNGTLQVVPGSHKRFGEIRGPMIPWELDNIKNTIIEKYLVPLETKAGDCVILDDSIVHYSAPNLTNELRLAIQLICIPSEMPSIHYHLDIQKQPQNVQMLQVDDEFYMSFNPWKKPENAHCLKHIPYESKMLNEEEFLLRMQQARFDEVSNSVNIFKQLKSIFNTQKS